MSLLCVCSFTAVSALLQRTCFFQHNLTNAVVYAATTMTDGVRSRLPHNAKHSTSIYDDKGHVEFDRTAYFARQLYVQCPHVDGEGLGHLGTRTTLSSSVRHVHMAVACNSVIR